MSADAAHDIDVILAATFAAAVVTAAVMVWLENRR